MATAAALLKKAEAALSKEPKSALPPLLDAWQASPAVEVSELVARLEALVAPPPFDGDTAAWVRASKGAEPWVKSALLAQVRGKTIADAEARFKAAVAWGPDPRTARALSEVVTHLPWTSDGSKDLWRTIFAGISAMKDPRFAGLAKTAPPKWKVRDNIRGWLTNGLLKAAGQGAAAPLESDVAEAVRSLAAKLDALTPKKPAPSRDEEGLLADVYANPADDAPRLVYADWLLERSDPRGEFITLQFQANKSPAALRREKALLKEHGKKWLGPLAPVIDFRTAEFRRGFLVKAETLLRADTEALHDSPAWATVEETSAGGVELTRPVMRHLKRLRGVFAKVLLAAKVPWPFEEVSCVAEDREEFRALLETTLLPKLTRLEVGLTEGEPLKNPKWLAGLARVAAAELTLRRVDFKEPIVDWVNRAGANAAVRTLVLDDGLGSVWRWTRGPDGRLSVLQLEMKDARYPDHTREMLGRLPGGTLSAFTVQDAIDPQLREVGNAQVASQAPAPEPKPAASGGKRPVLTTRDSFKAIAWRPEGWWAADDGVALLIDPATGKRVRELELDTAQRVCFSADGKRVVSVNGGRVRACSLETGKLLATVNSGASGAQDLKISHDGRFALVAAQYHAYFCDLDGKKMLRKAKAKIYYSGAVSPDGGRFATPLEIHERPAPEFDVIQVMDGRPGSRAVKFGVDVVEPAWLPDGRILCCNRDQHRLLIFDSVTGAEQLSISGGLEFPESPVVSPSGTHAVCWSDKNLALLDLVAGKVLWLEETDPNRIAVDFSPDGAQLVLGSPTPRVFDVRR